MPNSPSDSQSKLDSQSKSQSQSNSLITPLPFGEGLGERLFPNPFFYTPHPLCKQAMAEVEQRLNAMAKNDNALRIELQKGKMIGVLIVEDQAGNLSYLAAFSGQIGDRDTLPGFVPPVFSYLSPQGYFKQEEANISTINKQISDMENSEEFASLKLLLADSERLCKKQIEDFKTKMADAKLLRDSRRQQGALTPAEEALMIKESQHLKAELRRLKARCKEDIDKISAQYNTLVDKIKTLKSERQQRSDSLQHWLFQHFVMLNGRGESKNLIEIFQNTAIGIPPSGSGECCEPRLLQYAFKQGLKPRLMAMMWVGESPRGVIRKHGSYYPACQGRCKPILDWMLLGIEVEPDHIDSDNTDRQLKILYSDSDIVVVGKPEGMLSVPGKSNRESVKTIIMQKYPHAHGPLIVHRLDMATSGIMLVALNETSYHNLQRQFAERKIQKRYVALLSRKPNTPSASHSGTITLPLAPDYMHRPCQKVDFEHGKPTLTEWRLDTDLRIILYPHTGRTHQLRLHCAHPLGLDAPIKGDTLYGSPSSRLYLHAEAIDFHHPTTGIPLHFEWKAEW